MKSRLIDRKPTVRQSVVIPRTETFQIEAGLTGALYQIFVAYPDGPEPEHGFPVIYILDANAIFASVVETVRRGIARPETTGFRPAVVVGIGYPIDGIYDSTRRTSDYTAFLSDRPTQDSVAMPMHNCNAFRHFIEDDLKPVIGDLCHVDTKQQIIFGHSLAGFFVLNLLCNHVQSFQSYIAASPSIWWDPAGIESGLSRLAGTTKDVIRSRRLFISVGEWEQTLSPLQLCSSNKQQIMERQTLRAMIDNAQRFFATAEARFGSDMLLRFELMKNEDHASVLPLAISHGLRFALSGI